MGDTDRLTPPQLRDLADLLDDPRGKQLPFHVFFRQEAARREAEAKPVKISQPECHEPGGCIAPVACVQFGKCPQKPEAAPQGEREGPESAAAHDDTVELANMLRDLARKYPHERGLYTGADRIEAQAREIASISARHSAALDQRDAEKARADRLAALLRPYACNPDNCECACMDWDETNCEALAVLNALTEGGDRG